MATVLIVDDEPKITNLVRSYLEHAGYRTMIASDGTEALSRALNINPDLIILDLMLPGLDGFEVTRRIRQETTVPIIMLTARSDEDDRLLGLDLGADDYVTKPFSPKELVARVRAVLRRTGNDSTPERSSERGAILVVGADGEVLIDLSRREVSVRGTIAPVTSYQFDLLTVLAGRPGHVFSRTALVDAVQGSSFDGYDRTVDAHIKNLRKALGDRAEAPRYIETIRGVGYRFVDGNRKGTR